jgi:hypothetical protein
MKKFLLVALSFCFAFAVKAQVENPVEWAFSAKKINTRQYEVSATATFSKPWHIYSQTTPDGGPVATKFSFNSNPLLSLSGKTKETGKLEVVHDKNFGVDVKFYSDKVVFTQVVNTKATVKTNITGTVEYMVCNDSRCLPPKKVPFDIQLQ